MFEGAGLPKAGHKPRERRSRDPRAEGARKPGEQAPQGKIIAARAPSIWRVSSDAHLDDGLLDAGLAPAVALDDGGLEGGSAQLGDVEHDLSAGGDQLPPVMPGAVRLAPRRSLVALGPDHLVGFLV